jgi:hypothetical protein
MNHRRDRKQYPTIDAPAAPSGWVRICRKPYEEYVDHVRFCSLLEENRGRCLSGSTRTDAWRPARYPTRRCLFRLDQVRRRDCVIPRSSTPHARSFSDKLQVIFAAEVNQVGVTESSNGCCSSVPFVELRILAGSCMRRSTTGVGSRGPEGGRSLREQQMERDSRQTEP